MKKATKEPKIKKISMNFPASLYEQVKERALEDNLTFSAEVFTLCRQGLEQSQTIKLLPTILEQLLNEQKTPKNKKK